MRQIRFPPILFTKTMDVYNPDSSGDYTVLAAAAVPCRLAPISPRGIPPGNGREELAEIRRLAWGADTVLPDHARVLIDGVWWNPVVGSSQMATGPSGEAVFQSADVRRVE